MRKAAKVCEACGHRRLSRFRTQVSIFMCLDCYDEWLRTSVVPSLQFDPTRDHDEDEEGE